MLHYNPQHVSSSTVLILRRTNCIITTSGIVTVCKRPYSMPVESGLQSALRVKYSLFLSGFNETWIFSTVFRKILKSNFLKIRDSWKSAQWEVSCSIQTEGQTDRHEEADSSNFANAPKKDELDENRPGMFEHFEYTVIVDRKIRTYSELFYFKVNVELRCM